MLQFDALCGAKNFEQLKKFLPTPFATAKTEQSLTRRRQKQELRLRRRREGIIGCHLPDTNGGKEDAACNSKIS